MHSDDVGMLQLSRSTRLANELLRFTRVELALAGNFDRHASIKLGVAGHPHRAKGTGSDLVDQLEVANRLRLGLCVGEGLFTNETELAAT